MSLLSFLESEETKLKSRFQRQTKTLIWKCYLQRQRRWRTLLAECILGLLLFVISVFIAKPVFLAPIQTTPQKPITSSELLAPVTNTILGYAPNTDPYNEIIAKASLKLQSTFLSAPTEDDLNTQLYERSNGSIVNETIIWIIFKPRYRNMWRFAIKSTDRARTSDTDSPSQKSSHSLVFLGIQMAISQAILERMVPDTPLDFEISLIAMPVSPLMQDSSVRLAISGTLLCYTLALIPPVIETQALVVHETQTKFKRALLMRHVGYSTIYMGWLVYAYLTVFPICVIGAIVLILIFRWIHLMYALMTLLSYVSVMIMLALIMAMFHNSALISCFWSILFTLLQTFLAELLVHHGFDLKDSTVSFLLHVVLPPLGLVHGFNQFALLQTGRHFNDKSSIIYTLLLWTVMNILYFGLLMLLQRTIGQERAIGGQVSWKSIIFKKVEDLNELHPIEKPTGREREHLQEVDELVAKAISFRSVSKSIMNFKVLNKITLDMYRGEFTMLFAERSQARMVNTVEDLLTGLSFPDEGTINILGKIVTPESNFISVPNMMGYCHRSNFLVDDLTVQEHLHLFIKLCLWHESQHFVTQYTHIRLRHLLAECDLEEVKHEYIENLDMYFRAQLCWAIALILEPRIIILPDYADPHSYVSVIRDKIMQYKKYITIVKMTFSTLHMEYADRIFLFDSKMLVFGGTPAYIFFKYGREYRVRMTFRGGGSFENERISELLDHAATLGATVRANLGSLIILRLPASPTANVAALVKDIQEKSIYYGVTSFSISLPDSEEVYRRAINDTRAAQPATSTRSVSERALKNIADPIVWKTRTTCGINMTHMRCIGWKYFSFWVYYRFYFIITVVLSVVTGTLIGFSLSTMLSRLEKDQAAVTMLHGEVLTVEHLNQRTTLIVSADTSDIARSIAGAYVLSETNATQKQINDMAYTALMSNELHALYSPMHKDKSAAARSLARLYMALIRHYTNTKDATIQFMKYAGNPPLVIMFLLIVTMSHVTLIPSKEHGMMKHVQSHAHNFSPAKYWFSLYFCDLILYWLLVGFIATTVVCVMYLTVPLDHFRYSDLLVVPFILIIYGVACVPQAYLFCRGPRAALNAMSFIIINIVFGEATVVAKVFFDLQNIVIYFMRMWPQFNTGYALVKIKKVFLYNSECVIFKTENLCSSKTLHKCCKKCGVLQQCYTERQYLTTGHGIMKEITSMLTMAVVFIIFLLLWEYQFIQKYWSLFKNMLKDMENVEQDHGIATGLQREKSEVLDKLRSIRFGRSFSEVTATPSFLAEKVNTFGESLLCANVTKKKLGEYVLRNIYLGVGRGEAIAISGLKKHGRMTLIEILAGLTMPTSGQVWAKSKWKFNSDPHQYCRQVSIAYERDPLPLWMTVYDALEMLALLRGVPQKYAATEVSKYIYALELQNKSDTLICRIPPNERTQLNFAAAVIGAPSVVVIDECTNFQDYSVCRAMYFILYQLKRRGHAIFISSHCIESHMPITNRLGILLDGTLVDVDLVDNLIARYSQKGFTVVVHLKDEVNVDWMFGRYFSDFVINDTNDVLVNVQVLDDLSWASIFEKMEELQAHNTQVYSYIVTSIPIDYIYNSIIVNEAGNKPTGRLLTRGILAKLFRPKSKIQPAQATLDNLTPFQSKYEITKLKELPWSVIFQR